MNKVVTVSINGGLIGWFAASPSASLHRAIVRENANGWKVVQVIPDAGHGFLFQIFRLALLLVTLLLFTVDPGYYIIMEKAPAQPDGKATSSLPACARCGHATKGGDAFCEQCGNKLS